MEVTATRALHIAREANEGSEKANMLAEKNNTAVAEQLKTQSGFEWWLHCVTKTADEALKIANENADQLKGIEDSPTSEREEDSPSSAKTVQY